jgi:hypothetical protein
MSEEAKMQKRILMLATSAFILAYGAATASAQQEQPAHNELSVAWCIRSLNKRLKGPVTRCACKPPDASADKVSKMRLLTHTLALLFLVSAGRNLHHCHSNSCLRQCWKAVLMPRYSN